MDASANLRVRDPGRAPFNGIGEPFGESAAPREILGGMLRTTSFGWSPLCNIFV